MARPDPMGSVKDWAVQNTLAGLVLACCAFLLFRTLRVPLGTLSTQNWIGYLCILLSAGGVLVIAGLFAANARGWRLPFVRRRGLWLVSAVIGVLFGYAVTWHLVSDYFKYPTALTLLAVLALAALQAALWDRKGNAGSPGAGGSRRSGWWLVPVAAAGVLLFLFSTYVDIRNVRFEDTFITLRYGWNLAQGNGINWNVSDPIPAEGYTSFIFVLLSGLFYALHLNPLTALHWVNLASLAVLAWFTWRLGGLVSGRAGRLHSLLAVVLLAALPATGFHIATGMETIFYAAALAGIAYCAARWLHQDGANWRWFAGLGGMILIAGLTRPDGVVYGAVTLILLALYQKRAFFRKAPLAALAASLLLPGTVYFSWRISYFKMLLPLSFYHKSFVGGPYAHAARGVLFTDFAAMLLLPFLGWILYRALTGGLSRTAYLLLIPCGLLVLYYSRVLAVAGLQYRFFYPYLFGFLVVGGGELADLFDGWVERLPRIVGAVAAAAAVCLLVVGPFWHEFQTNLEYFVKGYGYYEPGDTYTNLGKALLNVDPAQTVGIGEVGKVGMLLRDYTVVDITGLNDRTLARSPLTLEYLNQREVNLLLTFPYPREALGPFADVYRKVGLAFPQIESAFTCIGFIQPLDVFVRQDPPQNVENMLTWLRKSPIFQEGVCKSSTLSRWSLRQMVLPLDGWQAKDMLALDGGASQQYQVSGDDPRLVSPALSIDTAAYNNLFITLKTLSPVGCPSLTVYFKRQGEDEDSETRSVHVDFTPTGEPQTLFANLRANPDWNGTLTGLRIDPVCGQNRQGEPVRLEVAQIELH